jgi:hypothetical protein
MQENYDKEGQGLPKGLQQRGRQKKYLLKELDCQRRNHHQNLHKFF